jgi:hypothetical protein
MLTVNPPLASSLNLTAGSVILFYSFHINAATESTAPTKNHHMHLLNDSLSIQKCIAMSGSDIESWSEKDMPRKDSFRY